MSFKIENIWIEWIDTRSMCTSMRMWSQLQSHPYTPIYMSNCFKNVVALWSFFFIICSSSGREWLTIRCRIIFDLLQPLEGAKYDQRFSHFMLIVMANKISYYCETIKSTVVFYHLLRQKHTFSEWMQHKNLQLAFKTNNQKLDFHSGTSSCALVSLFQNDIDLHFLIVALNKIVNE